MGLPPTPVMDRAVSVVSSQWSWGNQLDPQINCGWSFGYCVFGTRCNVASISITPTLGGRAVASTPADPSDTSKEVP